MRFLDLVRIHARSGAGGNGAISFRREKFVEFGGPDGGNGGNGGNIFAETVPDLNTLIDFRYRSHVIAGDGRPGRGRLKTGARGRNVVLQVPVGTELLDEFQDSIMLDMTETGVRHLLLAGGNGGFGNHHFRSSTNQAPRIANKGQPGQERTFWLRLKLLADVGILGLPNAGKSTLLAAVSNATPRIADYPFTTLQPNLGLVRVHGTEFVLADIPGLIEGAHEGKGIGIRFLGHVERCRVLLHLVDATSDSLVRDYQTVIGEIASYGNGLLDKPRIIVLSKADSLSDAELGEQAGLLEDHCRQAVLPISAVSGAGIESCMGQVAGCIAATRATSTAGEEKAAWTP